MRLTDLISQVGWQLNSSCAAVNKDWASASIAVGSLSRKLKTTASVAAADPRRCASCWTCVIAVFCSWRTRSRVRFSVSPMDSKVFDPSINPSRRAMMYRFRGSTISLTT
ncbi:Uncharacterised protein [Mycobacteroides abscessus subsp. abscessus]|nr:Uncharacterised protein [Mycobacteroides abscessus subsp. abscessus]